MYANIAVQALSVQTTTTSRHSARHLLVAQQRVVASLVVERRLEARHLAGLERTAIHHLGLAAVLALAQAFSEARASLPSAVAQPQTPVEVCSAVEALAGLAPTTPQADLVVARLADLARQQPMHPTTELQARYSRPIQRRMERPRRSTTRPSPSNSRIQTTLLKS